MKMDKYNFQNDAIKNIIADFQEDHSSRLLLVIPTGGGKTLTAIRAVNELINKGLIDKNNKCLWITHRKALKKQTSDVVDNKKWIKKFNFSPNLNELLHIEMIKAGEKIIKSDKNETYKFIIIDECHHSKASSYSKFFDRKNLGILGLTATPTRLDKKELDFDKITYQTTFKKLVKLGVIVEPNFNQFHTNQTINASNINLDSNESEKFNTDERNHFVVSSILDHKDRFSKVVIYVNTIKHAKSLYKQFEDRDQNFYDFIGYIAGGDDNPLRINNNKYLEKFKNAKNAIIINTNILTEGFDDPNIDTVAMAVPTGSLVRYIQCIGRAIRNPDVDSVSSSIHPEIIEFTDNLPDVGYRIKSGWLFADISDDLQPEIHSIYFRNTKDLKLKIQELVDQYSLKGIDVSSVKTASIDSDTINLFVYTAFEDYEERKSAWRGLLVDKDFKEDFVYAYNNINHAIINNLTITQAFDYKFPDVRNMDFLNTTGKQQNLWHAMSFAYNEIKERRRKERLKYFIFDKIDYPYEVEEFLSDCFNSDEILAEYSRQVEEKKSEYILKFPSKIINQCEAYYCTEEQYLFCNLFIDRLKEKILVHEPYEANLVIESLLKDYDSFKIPLRFVDGLCLINKTNIQYYIKI
tara:strand:+ start:5376 stop:7280 length:1905 start_codon:yes stop_codon:yes gene_type:complete